MCGPPPWPAFRDEWILYHDEDLLVVHKPTGVSSRCGDAEVPDDLAWRLSEHLSADCKEPRRLTAHQPLDQDSSGVVLCTISDRAKRAMGQAFENHQVSQEYLAWVVGRRPPEGTMEDTLRRGANSKLEVVKPGAHGGKLACAHVRLLERRGDKRLITVRIESGGTQQLRAQLAHRGCPVAGDRRYGGVVSPRLMLHASRMEFTHPGTGSPLVVDDPPPACFERMLADVRGLSTGEALADALGSAAERRYALGRARLASQSTTAFRWVHGLGDGLPGLKLDVFGDYVVVHVYDDEAEASVGELLELLRASGWAGAYVKRRPKKASGLSAAERLTLTPVEPAFGPAAPQPMTVLENGTRFEVDLGGSFGVGLFLDQRQNRARVRGAASGRRVLNLFAHTCSFTVAAALGGATSTLSVDASRAALERGRANLAAAGIEAGPHRFIKEDVFLFLSRLARRGERFDLVVVDPPTYSTTRSKRWKSGEGWVELSRACLEICAPLATLLATTNDTRLTADRFRRHLHEGARRAERDIARMKGLPPGHDFPASHDAEPGAQSQWLELGD